VPRHPAGLGRPPEPVVALSTSSPDPLEWLLHAPPGDNGIDRKALAGLFLDIARSVRPDLAAEPAGAAATDIRLQQLRDLLMGQEIAVLARLSGMLEDPEQLAAAVARILPTAFAQAQTDLRLGQVLAPALEKATQTSVRNDPHTLVNILYPLIVPAIRKSIGETIDKTFQSLNESLKHSLTLRGLAWRWEAWRTGVSFAEVVLRHTLVYQVEHVFLIHRHTGLLISHVAAQDAVTQDPQLVSAMLTAIQDFVRDSFSGAEHQGVDTMRLGELTVWSEPGPFATLVAVIRGKPPEELHETLNHALSRIHAERHQALEDFDGDATGLADVEAELTECVALRQQRPQRQNFGFPWLALPITVAVLLAISAWGVRRWQEDRRWDNYIALLRSQPGIVVTNTGRRDGKFVVTGLRDPLAIDPRQALRSVEIDPADVIASWAPYQALDPVSVQRRLQAALDPPPSVVLSVEGDHIKAQGSAPAAWLDRARAAERGLPAGTPTLDLASVRNLDAPADRQWNDYVARLRTQPGIVVTETGRRDGKFLIAGLRDPFALDPGQALTEAGIEPASVIARWSPYQALDPQIVLRRLQATLTPPPSVRFGIEGDRIVAQGSAPQLWLERAHLAARVLPSGAPVFDLSAVKAVSDGAIGRLRDEIQARTIRFNNNEPLPAPGQDPLLDRLASDLKALETLAPTLHVAARVMVTGHSDSLGTGTFNLSLSLARAEAVRALLRKRGVDPDLLTVRGAGNLEPVNPDGTEAARSANRRVSFTVGLEEQL
jgi:outer membrane protein OmpA-like peptidoglycan-associated protein